MKNTRFRFSILLVALVGLACHAPVHAATLISGYEVGGTTTSISLTAGSLISNPNGNTQLSNDAGNLVVNLVDPNPGSAELGDNDFWMRRDGAGDGLSFSTTTYTYVQVDIINASAGLPTANWQMFWQDDDSGIGGPNNSSTNFGPIAPEATPFSFVIDLTDGGTNNSGATGWGPGQLDSFRFDPFQSSGSFGESFTITGITFGSEITAIPEPSTALLGAIGLMAALLRRQRRLHFLRPMPGDLNRQGESSPHRGNHGRDSPYRRRRRSPAGRYSTLPLPARQPTRGRA
jgi:hypothetical protein